MDAGNQNADAALTDVSTTAVAVVKRILATVDAERCQRVESEDAEPYFC